MTRTTIGTVVGFALGCLLTAFIGWLWTTPSGEGEYAESPDRKNTAHASNFTSGTREYVELKVVDNMTGEAIWKMEVAQRLLTSPPDYGDRQFRYITWSPDSTAVSFVVNGGQVATVDVRAVDVNTKSKAMAH